MEGINIIHLQSNAMKKQFIHLLLTIIVVLPVIAKGQPFSSTNLSGNELRAGQNEGPAESSVMMYALDPEDLSVHLIIDIGEDSFKAFYSEYIGDGGWDYYLSGSFSQGVAKCKVLACRNYGYNGEDGTDYNNVVDDCGTKVLYLKSQGFIINVDDPDPLATNQGWQLELLDTPASLPCFGELMLRDTPSFFGNSIATIDCENYPNEIIEIGPFENKAGLPGFWYRVRVNGREGWIFGG